MKRKGETFTEFLTAATVFGVITAGMFEFIANQTENLASIRDKDNLMYIAQRYVNIGYEAVESGFKVEDYSFTDGGRTIVVTNDTSLTFNLKPTQYSLGQNSSYTVTEYLGEETPPLVN